MTDVLLIYPTYTYTRKNPSLGLAYIAGALEKAGYSVRIIDMSPMKMGYSYLRKEIIRIDPGVVGISFMTNQFCEAIKISKIVKEINADTPVVAGGPHASAIPGDVLLNNSIDFVVIGEGEVTAVELVARLLNNSEKFDDIAGIAYRRNGGIVITAARNYIQDLDSICFPAWHLLPIERYSVLASGGDISKKVLPILSSRGCPNQCIFCSSHVVFGRKFRARSADNIVAEICYLKDTYNVSQFDFVDDTMTIDPNRTTKFCNLIIERKLKINWMCNTRVNTVNMDILQLMKKAGCVRIDLGIESVDGKVLKAIKKGITLLQIKVAHEMVRQAGIQSNSFIMVGNLEEDFNSVKKTVQMVKDFVEDANVSISTPFPGTDLYKIAKDNNWLMVQDWSRYVTAPTYLPGYRPVMITDKMTGDDMMRAFFYVHSMFAKRKFETRYGKHFYLNPYFYSDQLFKINSLKDFLYKFSLLRRLIFQTLRKNG